MNEAGGGGCRWVKKELFQMRCWGGGINVHRGNRGRNHCFSRDVIKRCQSEGDLQVGVFFCGVGSAPVVV